MDFSIFDGMLQNALIGKWGFEDITNIYHFAVHQNWILLLILPFYYLFSSSILLILLGSLLMWVPGILIIYLVKKLGYNDFVAYLAAIFWWTSPFTAQSLHVNFVPELFYPITIFLILISHPLDAFINIVNSVGWKKLYFPLLLLPLLNLEVFLSSLPIIILYGVSSGNPVDYSGYYPIVLWSLTVYGLFKNNFTPNWLKITILFIFSLINSSWIGIYKIDWLKWKNVRDYKKEMVHSNIYCAHPGLFPYLTSSNINLKPFYEAKNFNCTPVFALSTSSYPQSKVEIEKFYEKINNENCIKYQLGSIVEIKDSVYCKNFINNLIK